MEAFVLSYRLPFPDFRELIMSTNSLVAGSSALALYMKQIGQEPGFVPTDMDIWMEDNHSIFLQNGHYNQRSNVARFYQFLTEHGYTATPKFANPNDSDYYNAMHSIKKIYSLVNEDGKEIQLIVVTASGLLHYIGKHFDLTICMTWWDAMYDCFRTIQPETTDQKIMIVNPEQTAEKCAKRIEKYTQRGYYIGTPPPDCIAMIDDREELEQSNLKNIIAFDVWAYDDINAFEFLKTSPWNMLLKVGEQFQAFHRKHLYEFMKARRTTFPNIGDVYDTPHNQSVSEEAFRIMAMGDYSIFELEKYQTMTQGMIQKTLFNVKCYTIREWNDGESEIVINIPTTTSDVINEFYPSAVESSPFINVQRRLVYADEDEEYDEERREAVLFQQMIFSEIAQGR